MLLFKNYLITLSFQINIAQLVIKFNFYFSVLINKTKLLYEENL